MNGRRAFNRILSQKTFNNNRPKTSLKSCSSFINRKNNITAVFIKSPHSILTKPNNSSKKLKGMGNKFEREELYQLKNTFYGVVDMINAICDAEIFDEVYHNEYFLNIFGIFYFLYDFLLLLKIFPLLNYICDNQF